MLVVVDEELVAVFIAGVTESLNGLVREQLPLISKTPVTNLIRPGMFGEVSGRNARRPSLKHENIHASLGEFFGHPSAACS